MGVVWRKSYKQPKARRFDSFKEKITTGAQARHGVHLEKNTLQRGQMLREGGVGKGKAHKRKRVIEQKKIKIIFV